MSSAKNVANPAAIVEANRELFEKLANSDLPVAKDVRNALDALEQEEASK